MNYLLDTDVLIDFLRGRAEAAAFLASLPTAPFISVITIQPNDDKAGARWAYADFTMSRLWTTFVIRLGFLAVISRRSILGT